MVVLIRLAGCSAALCLGIIFFPGSINIYGLIWGALLLTVFYTLLRPLLLTLALPFNLLLGGLITPLADALLIRWAAAWINGLMLNYWQCVALALTISLAYWPYSMWKQRQLPNK